MTATTLESFTVIRVGMPGAPYVVGVVRSEKALQSVRLAADPEDELVVGSDVERVGEESTYQIYRVVPKSST